MAAGASSAPTPHRQLRTSNCRPTALAHCGLPKSRTRVYRPARRPWRRRQRAPPCRRTRRRPVYTWPRFPRSDMIVWLKWREGFLCLGRTSAVAISARVQLLTGRGSASVGGSSERQIVAWDGLPLYPELSHCRVVPDGSGPRPVGSRPVWRDWILEQPFATMKWGRSAARELEMRAAWCTELANADDAPERPARFGILKPVCLEPGISQTGAVRIARLTE